jgi:amino acid transporter
MGITPALSSPATDISGRTTAVAYPGFTGAVAGPIFGFVSAWTLMLVYTSFAGGLYVVTADTAQPAFGVVGLHLPWQVYAISAVALVTLLAYLDIKVCLRLGAVPPRRGDPLGARPRDRPLVLHLLRYGRDVG